MPLFALRYEIHPDYFAIREPFKAAHVAQVQAAVADGSILTAGVFGMPPLGADYVFSAETREPVEAFARADPYVANGIVTAWRVEPWHAIAGPGAE